MSNIKTNELMDLLSTAYADEKVAELPELRQLLFKAAQELEKSEDTRLVAVSLCNEITLYALAHQNRLPEAISALYYQIKREAEIYKGIALSTMSLPVWF